MAIDILYLVDRLEALVERGRHLPLTSTVMVDARAFLDIVDQMRISIPEEIKQAKRLQEEREKIIEEAQDEAARIISKAREDAARLVAEHELRRQVQQQADRVLDEVQRQALAIRQGADDYAAEVLAKLQEELSGLQRTIANGLAALDERRSGTSGSPAGVRGSHPEAASDEARPQAL